MTLKFTARTAATLKPIPGRRVDYFDATVAGLALRVTEDGHKSWSVHYRTNGRLRRYTIGDYPTITLEKARKEATRALRAASDGEDPAAEKKAARRGETVAELAKEYLERHAKKQKRSWRE